MPAPRSLLHTFMLAMMIVPGAFAAGTPTTDPGGETQPIWPQGFPNLARINVRETFIERNPEGSQHDRFVEHVTRPAITFFHAKGKPNGVTLLIVPGGGYVRVVFDKEGFETAEWFASQGFECAVLRYRLPADGWKSGADAPVFDAQRAIRLLRSQPGGSFWSTAPRIGVIGFSAGGHVLARLITEPGLTYPRIDSVDELSAMPDFAALMYPVITTTGPAAHAGAVQQLLASGISPTDLERYSPNLRVTNATPPTILIHAADDVPVPMENSLLMFNALHKAGVRSELHIFDSGGHGFGMRSVAGKDIASWPKLVRNWALGQAAPRD
jgi:acetyl esterase/lipase